MTGFGSTPFGATKAGEPAWAHRVTYESLPRAWRAQDARLGYPFRDFLAAYESELDRHRIAARGLPDQRDPLHAIASNVTQSVQIASSLVVDDAYWGRTVELTAAPGASFGDIGVGWIVRVEVDSDSTREYKVVRVRSRNDVGQADATANTLLVSGPAVEIVPQALVFQQPSMLQHLAKDYGVVVDDQEPLQFQRSTVANAGKLRAIKSNAKSYSIRGDMAGFLVEAVGLYAIDSVPVDLPPELVFEIPGLSGNFYSSALPPQILFDEIPADVQFEDPEEGEVSLLDRNYAFEDNSADAQNPTAFYMQNVLIGYFPQGGPVPADDTIEVTGSVTTAAMSLPIISLAAAYSVTVLVTPDQRQRFGHVTQGVFSLVNPNDTDDRYVVEAELDYDGTTWTVATDVPVPNGDYWLEYRGHLVTGCGWCRSNRMVIIYEATQQLIDGLSAESIQTPAAFERMFDKLERLIPAHVRTTVTERVRISVRMTPVATIGPTNTEYMIAPFQAYFDDHPADEFDLDLYGPKVSLTAT